MKNIKLFKQLKINSKASLRVYKVGEVYRAIICVLDGFKDIAKLLRVPGKYSSIPLLRREAERLFEKEPTFSKETHRTPAEAYVGLFEYRRTRNAEKDYNFFELFYLSGLRSHNWPSLLIQKRYRPNSALINFEYDENEEIDEEEEFLESVMD